ncbi:MAG: DUF1592 domain-containing protein, partial [Lentisphaeraceae bacterium]|nr:DUF1592 domain-containing protein [Lentisphaeraceae bacterium]
MKRIIISLLLMSFSANADIKKFMDRYCIDCHDEDIQKGDLRLDTFSFSKENFDKAQAVLEVLEAIEMPPKKKKRQPSLAERHEAMEILDQFLSAKSILNTKNMRKLTLREYTNTLNDTLKTNYDFSEIINPEEYGEHFNNLAKNQFASVNTLSNYIEAATLISKKTIVSDQPQVANILIKAKSLVSTAKDYVYDKQKKTVLITELKNNRGGLSLPNHKIAHDGRYKITFSAQSKSKVSKPVNIYKGVPTVFKTYVKVGELPILNKLRDYSIELDLEKGDQLIFNIPMNPKLSSKYKKGDKTLLEKIDVSSVRLDGPFYDSWPPIQTKQIFSNLDYRDPNNSKVAINQIIKTFIKKPLTPQQYALFYDSYKKEYTKTNSAQKALQKVMQSLLSSPAFLYRTEVSGQIDSYSLANRLSFFLWGTLADKVLLDDAKNNSLQNDGTLNNHIERMLNDSRTNRFLDDFTHQWLWLNKVGEMIPNRDLYGRYNDRIKELFIEETKAFVKEI